MTPAGTEWRVGRVWIGRGAPRFRKVRSEAAGDIGGQVPNWVPVDIGSWGDLEATIAVVIALVLLVFVIIPLLLFGVELIIVGVAVAASIIGRLLLGRPWIVQAQSIGRTREVRTWRVSGWRRSRQVIAEIAQGLAAGSDPNPTDASDQPTGPERLS
jgi:hypothetical protein